MRRPYIHFFHIRCFSRDRLLSITAISLTTEIGKSAYRSSDNPEVGLFGVKLTYNALLVEVQPLTPRKSCCGRSPADNSLRFLPTDGQTGTYSSPLHRQRCMSPKSTPITRPSPQ